jgi:hypothetical protein
VKNSNNNQKVMTREGDKHKVIESNEEGDVGCTWPCHKYGNHLY